MSFTLSQHAAQWSILGPLLFLLDTNYLPKIIYIKSKPLLFAYDTTTKTAKPNPTDLKYDIYTVFEHANKWFKVNLVFLNFYKINHIQFITENNSLTDMNIG